MERIPASERTREKLKAMFEGSSDVGGTSELVRLAARLIIEEALEGEARDALGRDYYARGAAPGAGHRNGYRAGRLRSAEGAIEYSAPQIADRAAPFRSAIREIVRGRTAELEALAVEMYARGLSTRDIEALFADGAGKSLLSRTAVSEITERLWAEYEGFAGRDLAEFDVVYLFVDGIAERLHLGQPREAVMAGWGILADGKKALLHLAPGTKEDTASCKEFFRDMRRRGLPDPLLVVSDGAPGIIRAIEECFPRALRQRCLAHKMRNLASKVTEDLWPEFKARAVACYQAASPALARLLRDDIRTTYGRDLPSAVSCLEDDFEACIAHLRFPLGHRRVIRTTDEIDKPFSAGSLAHVGTSRALERARQPFCPSKARWPRGLLGCGFVNADSRRRRWPQASVYKAASQQRQSAVALGGLPCSKATTAGIAQCPVRDAFGMRCGIVILHGRPRGEEQGWRMKALPRSL